MEICEGKFFEYKIRGDWMGFENKFLKNLDENGKIASFQAKHYMNFEGTYLISLQNNSVFSI